MPDHVDPNESQIASLVGQVADDFVRRYAQGEDPDVEEYANRHSQIATVLRQLLPALKVLGGLSARPDETPEAPQQMRDATSAYAAADISGDWPARAGRFHIREEIARGGMGAVLRAHDPGLNRTLAIKVMLQAPGSNADFEKRFLEETQITGQLQHPGIAPVHEQGRLEDGRPFFAMKLIEGRTLSDLLKERSDAAQPSTPVADSSRGAARHELAINGMGEPPVATALPRFIGIFEQICQTIAYAHSQGVIHRDLKPGNIMVGAFGEVQVMDWGLAKAVSGQLSVVSGLETPESAASKPSAAVAEDGVPSHTPRTTDQEPRTREGAVMGTPAYMAPEQARGEIAQQDKRTDVFGLGAILCSILTDKPPFWSAKPTEVLSMADRGDLEQASARLDRCGADRELVDLCKKCLAPDKTNRPRDASEVADAVATYQEGVQEKLRQAELEQAQARAKSAEERKRRRWIAAAAAATVLFVMAVAGGLLVYQSERARFAAKKKTDEIRQEAERNQRQALREQQIETAIERAQELRGRLLSRLAEDGGVLKLLNGPSAWKAQIALVRACVQQARDRQQGSEGRLKQELARQLHDLSEKLKRDDEARQLALNLEKVRLQRSTLVDGKLNHKLALDKYPDLFRRAGLDLQKLEPLELAERIQRSSIQEQLAAALDDWALVLSLEKKVIPQRQLAVARLADPDPWRNRIRDPKNWGTRENALKLADELRRQPHLFRKLSPKTLVMVGNLLRHWGQETDWLRQAQALHPSDFWINFDLATSLFESHLPESMGFFRAALAVRPNSAFAYNGLGAALNALNTPKERQAAIANFQKAIALDSKFAQAYFNLAIAMKAKKDAAGAIENYRMAIKLNPDDAKAYNNLAAVLRAEKDLPGALANVRKAVALDHKNVKYYNNLGLILYEQNDLEGAISQYRLAIKLNSKDAQAYHNFGNALVAQNDLSGAVAKFEKAIALDSNFSQAYCNLGCVLLVQDDLEGGIANLQKAIELDSKNAKAYYNLGVGLEAKGDLSGVIVSFEKVMALEPANAKARTKLAQAYGIRGNALQNRKNLPGAVANYRRAIELVPKNAKAHNNLGTVLAARNDLAGAIASFEKAVALDPKYARAYDNLGLAHSLKREMKAAVANFHKAIALDPKLASAHYNLGNVLLAQNNRTGAVASYKKAIQFNPNYSAAYGNLGAVLLAQADVKNAVVNFQKAIALNPDNAKMHNNLGVALATQKDFAGAIAQYQKAIRLDQKYANAYYNLGNALRERNDLTGAIVNYRKAIALNPTSANPYVRLGFALRDSGRFADADAALARAMQCLPQGHSEGSRLAGWRQQCRQLLALEKKLPAALKGAKISARDHLNLAVLCQRYLKRYPDAVKLYADAFAAKPKLAGDLQKSHRFNAACAAALAAAGLGKDAITIDAAGKAKMRRQVIGWLRADLSAYAKTVQANPQSAVMILKRLEIWKNHAALGGVREAKELTNLTEKEQQTWRLFWSDVDQLRKMARVLKDATKEN